MPKLTLELLPDEYAICRLAPQEPIPQWAQTTFFCSITRTADELSIVCPIAQIPWNIELNREWRVFMVCGPLAFEAAGIAASITEPLARAGISIIPIGTFDTDYVLVKADRLNDVQAALVRAGHTLLKFS